MGAALAGIQYDAAEITKRHNYRVKGESESDVPAKIALTLFEVYMVSILWKSLP